MRVLFVYFDRGFFSSSEDSLLSWCVETWSAAVYWVSGFSFCCECK